MINFPTSRKQVESRARADVKSQLPTSNPWLKNSFLGALITGISGRVYESYLQMKNVLLEMYPDTADGDFLARWGSYVSINRNPSTQASGQVFFSGLVGTFVPIGTNLSATDGNTYSTTASGTVSLISLVVSSLTQTAGTATLVSSSPHLLASGAIITITGASDVNYNISVAVNVIDSVTVSFSVDPTAAGTATGSSASYLGLLLPVLSVSYGAASNQLSGAPLTITSAIAGISANAFVDPGQLGGGSDVESDEAYRSRVLYRYQNPVSMFNVASITGQVFQRTGVTRVWVKQAGSATNPTLLSGLTQTSGIAVATFSSTHNLEDGQIITISGAAQAGYNKSAKVINLSSTQVAFAVDSATVSPATGTIYSTASIPSGQVKVYFMRDNDSNPIPSLAEVNIVSNLVQAIRPAHVSALDCIVQAPVAVPVNFSFNGTLIPNTATMRAAIQTSLQELFSSSVDVGVSLQSSAYISAIWQTIDSTGARVNSFTLTAPSGNVAILEGQIASLGTITF